MSVPNRRSANDLARDHQAALLAFAHKLCGQPDDARDLVQDTFERALRADVAGRPRDNERAWLFAVMHNLFIDRCRKRARTPAQAHVDDVDVVAREPEPPPSWTALSVDDVRAALAELDAEFREAYRLHALDGLGYAEIAARLGLPVSTIGTRIMRARRKLRAILQRRAPAEDGQ